MFLGYFKTDAYPFPHMPHATLPHEILIKDGRRMTSNEKQTMYCNRVVLALKNYAFENNCVEMIHVRLSF